jgi:molybdate-binding protein
LQCNQIFYQAVFNCLSQADIPCTLSTRQEEHRLPLLQIEQQKYFLILIKKSRYNCTGKKVIANINDDSETILTLFYN